ncbi:class I SAM-dependent methyltransferase [Luteithermobacter gelatinilyticus]|uniref:class I SAM-dependent methyltransferase n=1 Tax=Luteithermobacter gelatinilyticus TaxID=2582913 RepID=UPI0011068BFB|nr:class I SAM-dependent methyltransferase [Luteithermobacter gelatinilyticus]|tara:strand:- start:3267 stop:3863 length:597 start_codon:yes stop_codon:yes gene_type:complete
MTNRNWKAFWQEYYEACDEVWTKPDDFLMQEVRTLKPGRALDLGAGQGADSIALAQQGWQVTAVDFSAAAIRDLARAAAQAGVRITTHIGDILDFSSPKKFDLIYLCFIHLPKADRTRLLAQIGDLLVPGGVVLYIGLTGVDFEDQAAQEDLFAPAEEIAGLLQGLEIEKTETRRRKMDIPGHSFEADGVVVRARRRP